MDPWDDGVIGNLEELRRRLEERQLGMPEDTPTFEWIMETFNERAMQTSRSGFMYASCTREEYQKLWNFSVWRSLLGPCTDAKYAEQGYENIIMLGVAWMPDDQDPMPPRHSPAQMADIAAKIKAMYLPKIIDNLYGMTSATREMLLAEAGKRPRLSRRYKVKRWVRLQRNRFMFWLHDRLFRGGCYCDCDE